MLFGAAVPKIHRLVLDEEPDDLAVGHIHHGLARLRIAVTTFGVRQITQLVEAVEVGAGMIDRLALLEASAEADVTIRECEQRFLSAQHVEIDSAPVQLPRIDVETGALLYGAAHAGINSSRSLTTTSAPAVRMASA